jgi:2-C-methyl-D-erythritol 4-phosphate cytidylyltransferase/2-C-methyl-D-erythritol 2,4-cyclodiphosphate synthase
VIVVAPPEWEEPAILLAEEIGASKVAACVAGGESRTKSVRAGVAEVPDDAAVILVHDAARPLLPDEVIGRLLGALGEGYDGAVPVLPVTDTVKRVRDGVVDETLRRDELVSVQTPQAFVAGALRAALRNVSGESAQSATDCASLVEANGGRIRAIEGDERLLKVTTRADLERVAAWL